MTDPDVPGPSDPYLREHLHWYTLNIPSKKNSLWVSLNYHKPIRNTMAMHLLLIYTNNILIQTNIQDPPISNIQTLKKFLLEKL